MKLRNDRAGNWGGATSSVIFAVLALGLCGLCTFQFRKEGQLRLALEELSRTNSTITGSLEESRKEAERWKSEVTETAARLAESEAVRRTNTTDIASLKSLFRAASNHVILLTQARDAFKERFEEQAENTRRAAETIQKLKADAEAEIRKIAAVAEERTATADKYAKDYQELLAAFEKVRAQAQAPPAK